MNKIMPTVTRLFIVWALFVLIALTMSKITYAQDPTDIWTIYTYSNHIHDLAADPTTGYIWAATSGGAVRWDPTTDTYVRYTVADGLLHTSIWHIAIDHNGNKWFGSELDGFTRLASDGTWTTFPAVDAEHNPRDIVVDGENNIWFATLSGVLRLAADGTTWTWFTTADGLGDNAVNKIAAAADGTMWFATYGGGISRRSVDNQWQTYTTITTTDQLTVAINTVTALTVDSQNNLWLNTADGLLIWRSDGSAQKLDPSGLLPSKEILGLHSDATSGIWIAYSAAVVHLVDGDVPQTIYYPTGLTAGTSYKGQIPFAQDGGYTWVGSFYDPWLLRLAPNGSWRQYATSDGLLDSYVGAIAVDQAENVWFGTLHGGISRRTPAGDWQSYPSNGVHEIAEDYDGNLWFATADGAKQYSTTGQWHHYSTANGLPDNSVEAVYVANDNSIWFGTLAGAVHFTPPNQWVAYTTITNTNGVTITDIAGDPDGNIWFATEGSGVLLRPPDGGDWTPYTTADGLASNYVRSVMVEDNGTAWFGIGYIPSGASPGPSYSGKVSRLANGTWTTDVFPDIGPSSIAAMTVDQAGNRWFAAEKFGLIRLAPGAPDNQRELISTEHGLFSTRVQAVAFNPLNNDLWVGTTSGATSLTAGPGQTCETALPLHSGVDLSGQLTDGTDQDLYQIDAAAEYDRIEVTLSSTQTNVIDLYLYRSCSAIGTARHSGGVDNNELRVSLDTVGQPGPYYLEVSAKPGEHNDPINYRLHLGLVKGDTEATRTLILTQEDRLAALFPTADMAAWRAKLTALANAPTVNGQVIWNVQTGTNSAVAQAYDQWLLATTNQTTNQTAAANQLAEALADWIRQRKAALPYLRYVVIAGDDRVIPHFRLPILAPGGDGWVTEAAYLADIGTNGITANSSIGTALQDNQTLTDDIYGAGDSQPWTGGILYMPELAVGRLIEEPADMTMLIDAFLANNGMLTLGRTLTAGYDFMQDAVEEADRNLANSLNATQRTQLFGNNWNANQLRTHLFTGEHDLIWLAAHAAHDRHQTPNHDFVTANDIRNASPNMAGAVAIVLACHAGLNVPGLSHTLSLDFPEAWSGQGVTFVGSTGWAYGLPNFLAYQEELLANLSHALVNGGGTAVGDALVEAKRTYYLDHVINHFHAKTLVGTVLYGLPMYFIQIPESNQTLIQASAQTSIQQRASSTEVTKINQGLMRKGSTYYLADSIRELVTTDHGSYYTFSGQRPHAEANEPLQPKLLDAVGELNADGATLTLHGVVFLSASYRDFPNFTPVIENAKTPGVPERDLLPPTFDAPGWYPSSPVQFQQLYNATGSTSLLFGGNPGQLVIYGGQYHAAEQTERLLDTIAVDEYFSDSTDVEPPTITMVEQQVLANGVALTVTATDESGIIRVLATYANDAQQQWQSVDLNVADATNQRWSGELPYYQDGEVLIQVVDGAGNRAQQMPILNAAPLFGECNNDSLVDAGDLAALVLEIFDNDGNDPANAVGGTFAGTAGCDANNDSTIDAGDLSCIVMLIFNGPTACSDSTPAGNAAAHLTIGKPMLGSNGISSVPVTLTGNGHAITAVSFALRLDPASDLADNDGDGFPDAVQIREVAAEASITVSWQDDRLNIGVVDDVAPIAPFADGILLRVELSGLHNTEIAFDTTVPPSLGNAAGGSVPVQVRSLADKQIFLPVVNR